MTYKLCTLLLLSMILVVLVDGVHRVEEMFRHTMATMIVTHP